MIYYIVSVLLLLFVWRPCMVINVSVQYNDGLLPDIILLTQCYYHRGTLLNAMKRFCICSLWSHLNILTFSPLTGGCSARLGAFWCFFKHEMRPMRAQEQCLVRSVVLDAHDFGLRGGILVDCGQWPSQPCYGQWLCIFFYYVPYYKKPSLVLEKILSSGWYNVFFLS